MKTRRFVDNVTITAMAGDGGNGCVSFRREKYVPRGGPDGGDGGRGGHVILKVDPDTDSLIALFFAPLQKAGMGGHGRTAKKHGRNGRDLYLKVPPGTEVWDAESGVMLGDLLHPGQELMVAEGGKGGLGNPHWKTSTHQAPREHTDGIPGQRILVRLELKMVADAGLVGFPNAGKSSLLGGVSNAHPKVAAYPFTTLAPIIGTVKYDDYSSFTLADIPGLLEHAHEGVGLGDRFLRHIERSPTLVYVIDIAGSEGRDPVEDYATLRRELRLYRTELLDRPSLVVANKMDLPGAEEQRRRFSEKTGIDPLPVSTVTGEGIDEFKTDLYKLVRRLY